MNTFVNRNYFPVLVNLKGVNKLVKPKEEISIEGFIDIAGLELVSPIQVVNEPLVEEIFGKAPTVANNRFSKRFK